MALVRATTTFHRSAGVTIREGDLLEDSDPEVKANPGLFVPVAATRGQNAGVEQATAAPGEKRSAPAKKTPAKKKAAG